MTEQSTLNNFSVESDPPSEEYQCEICGQTFESSRGRGIHRGRSHSEEKIKQVYIEELQRLADELDHSPSLRDMNQDGAHSSKTYQDAFGSWNEALRQAGIEINNEQNILKSDLLDELIRLKEELGRTPTSRDMAMDGKYATGNYSRKFGTWNDAIRKAGLEPTREQNISTEKLLDDFDRVAEKLGHPPTAPQMEQHGDYAVSTYTNEFDTWNDAVREAGFEPVRKKNASETDLIRAIHDLGNDLGRAPSAFEMDKVGDSSVLV